MKKNVKTGSKTKQAEQQPEELFLKKLQESASTAEKKQKSRLSLAKRTKKSDDIIVVAKQPIEDIINETISAKQIKSAVKKVKNIKTKVEKKNSKANELYRQAHRLVSNVYSQPLEIKKLDYSKLYSYLKQGKKQEQYSDEDAFSRDELGERETMNDEEVSLYINKAMINALVGGASDLSFEEREKMKYYAMFNKSRIMMKISLNDYKLTDNFDLDKIV